MVFLTLWRLVTFQLFGTYGPFVSFDVFTTFWSFCFFVEVPHYLVYHFGAVYIISRFCVSFWPFVDFELLVAVLDCLSTFGRFLIYVCLTSCSVCLYTTFLTVWLFITFEFFVILRLSVFGCSSIFEFLTKIRIFINFEQFIGFRLFVMCNYIFFVSWLGQFLLFDNFWGFLNNFQLFVTFRLFVFYKLLAGRRKSSCTGARAPG